VKTIGNLTEDAIIRAVASEGFTVSNSVGSGSVYEAASTGSTAIGYDSSNGKVIFAYQDQGNSNYATAIVGTVSGTSVSFGTAVVYESANIHSQRIVFDSSNNKVVILYADAGNSDYGTAVVGTVSGTSISFGTPVVFNSAGTSHVSADFDTTANKIVIAYAEGDGKAVVGTVSGTSISFGSEVTFESGGTYNTATVYDTNANKTVISYRDNGDGNKGKAIVGTVSGTSISFGSIVVMDTENTRDIMASYDPVAQKILFVYKILSSPNPGYTIVGTVSGTSISFGTRAEYHAGSTDVNRVAYDVNAAKHVILFRDQDHSPYRGKIIEATVSGTSVSYSDELQWSSTSFSEPAITYDTVQKKAVFAYTDANNGHYGTARVYTTSLTSATGGTISDGAPVIINANGTVSSVGQSSLTEALGSKVVFETSNTGEVDGVYDTANDKVVITYRDAGDSNKGTAVVGTINASDNSITFGTPVVFTTKNIEYSSCTYDTVNNKVVIAYANSQGNRYGHAIVGTVSGTTISFGSEATFNSYEVQFVHCGFDESAGKVVIAYEDWGNNNYGMAIVGTVSGTSITFGSEVTYESARTQNPAVVYDANAGKTVIAFKTYGDSEHGYAIVGTVSGTSISFGSKAEFENATVNNVHAAYDSSAQKIVIAYRDYGNSYYGTAVVATVSGTSISFGTPVVFESAAVGSKNISIAYDSNIGKIVIAHTYNKKVITGTVSGTSISFDTAIVYDSGANTQSAAIYDATAKKVVIAYSDGNNSTHGTAIVYQGGGSATNLTSENFVGIMNGPTLDTTTGEVLSSCNVARNLTSLTPGQTYFVSPTNGTLSETAGSPSVTAGTAISSTELIVKG